MLDNIRDKAVVIITKNNVYRLSKPNENGERRISRDNKKLNFERCWLVSLRVGEPLVVKILDGLDVGEFLISSVVDFINEDIIQ